MSNVHTENVEKGDDTMFYITLTIEEDGQPPVNITPSNYGDSDMDSNTYSQVTIHFTEDQNKPHITFKMSTDSGSGIMRSITPNNLFPASTGQKKLPPKRRKSSSKTPYAIVRPLVPPPAPPCSSSSHNSHDMIQMLTSPKPYEINYIEN